MESTTAIATIPPAHADSELISSLCTSGSYRTPEKGRRIGLSRLLGRWNVWVYWRVVRVIINGSRVARHGNHDAAQWRRESEDLLQIMEAAGARVDITGMEGALRLDGPAVYVANHMSMLETFFMPGIVMAHGDLSYILKASLLKYPIFGRLLSATTPIAVSRTDPRADLKLVMSKGPELIKAGHSIVVFPQATRSDAFVSSEFNTLGVKLAQRAGVPVVPVALKTDFMRVGRIARDFGPLDRSQPIHLRFAPPIMPPYDSRDTHNAVIGFIQGCLQEWGCEVAPVGE